LKLCLELSAPDIKVIERERERERERGEIHKAIYPSSFRNPEVVQSPCHLQEIFHYNQSDYSCSSTKARLIL